VTTLSYGIATGTDDGYTGYTTDPNAPTLNDLTSTTMIVGCIAPRGSLTRYDCGVRFQAVALPNAQTLDSGFINIYLSSETGANQQADVYGDDIASCATFSATAPNRPGIQDCTETAAVLAIDGLTVTENKQLDVQAHVEEIVALGGWADGNDMRFSFQDSLNTAQSRYYQFSALEHSTEAEAFLDIIYTPAAGGITNTNMVGSAGRMAGNGGGLAG